MWAASLSASMPRLISALVSRSRTTVMPCSRGFCLPAVLVSAPLLLADVMGVMLLVMAAGDPSVRDAIRTSDWLAGHQRRQAAPGRSGRVSGGAGLLGRLDRGRAVRDPVAAVVVPGDRLQILEPDRLTLAHLGLITSHRDPDHLPSLGIHGEHFHNPLGLLGLLVHLLLGAAVLGLRLGGPRHREGRLRGVQKMTHDHHSLMLAAPCWGQSPV